MNASMTTAEQADTRIAAPSSAMVVSNAAYGSSKFKPSTGLMKDIESPNIMEYHSSGRRSYAPFQKGLGCLLLHQGSSSAMMIARTFAPSSGYQSPSK